MFPEHQQPGFSKFFTFLLLQITPLQMELIPDTAFLSVSGR
jgi:hypothetical protein